MLSEKSAASRKQSSSILNQNKRNWIRPEFVEIKVSEVTTLKTGLPNDGIASS
jgi:hypothetical protein